MTIMYDELEILPRCDNVNGVPISELQAFASKYGINHVYSVIFSGRYKYHQGCAKKLNDIYIVYLNHRFPLQCVGRNPRLEEYQPDIIECLETLLTTDRKAAYFVLLHEIGHKELGHSPLLPPPLSMDKRLPWEEALKKLKDEQEKWKCQKWQHDNIFEPEADNWAIAEFKKLQAEGIL
ncbi:hypothetical protein H8E77_08720 [bacterium]|nr:hypothetical protein [bacterium]